MRKGNVFITWGFGLILLAIGIQLVWSILLQFKVAIGIMLLLICLGVIIWIINRLRRNGDHLIIR